MGAGHGLALDLAEQPVQVGPVDVEGFVQGLERCVDVAGIEADAERSGQIGRSMDVDGRRLRNMRILPSRQAMEGDAEADQDEGVQADGGRRETGSRTTRWPARR